MASGGSTVNGNRLRNRASAFLSYRSEGSPRHTLLLSGGGNSPHSCSDHKQRQLCARRWGAAAAVGRRPREQPSSSPTQIAKSQLRPRIPTLSYFNFFPASIHGFASGSRLMVSGTANCFFCPSTTTATVDTKPISSPAFNDMTNRRAAGWLT